MELEQRDSLGRLMQNKISNKPTNKPVKPEVKTQAAGKPMPIVKYINTMNRLYGYDPSATDEYGNAESATDRIREQDKQKKAPKMSATRSWQIIKSSMSKDELEEHYKDHPEDRPMKLAPIEYDKGLTDLLGEDWLI